MSRIFATGAETGDTSEWSGSVYTLTAVSASNVNPYTGTYSLEYGGLWQSYLYKNFFRWEVGSTIYGSFYYSWHWYTGGWGEEGTGFETNTLFWLWGPSGVIQVALGSQHCYGTLSAWRAPSTVGGVGTVLGTSERYILSPETWHLIEFKIVCHWSDGIFQVKVDGKLPLALDLTGVNTRGDLGPPASIDLVGCSVGHMWRSNAFLHCFWDDIILDTSSWTNGSRLLKLPISGNGSINEWTPSTGTQYTCIDETAPDDSDYISTTAPDAINLFTSSGIANRDCKVNNVKVSNRAWKEGGPSTLTLLPIVKSGLTIGLGSQLLMPLNKVSCDSYFPTNPMGNLWTIPEINASEFGVQNLSGRDCWTFPELKSLTLTPRAILFPFISDSSCKAAWLFEDPNDLGYDSNGHNRLIYDVGYPGEPHYPEWYAPTLSYSDYRQGSASLHCEYAQLLKAYDRADGDDYTYSDYPNLDPGFPFSLGDTVKKITMCGWFKPSSLPSPSESSPMGYMGGSSMSILAQGLGATINIFFHESVVTNGTYVSAGVTAIVNTWYHIAVTYDDSTLGWTSRVYNATLDSVTSNSGTLGHSVFAGHGFFYVGAIGYYYDEEGAHNTGSFQGFIDKVMIFNRVLSSAEIDSMR